MSKSLKSFNRARSRTRSNDSQEDANSESMLSEQAEMAEKDANVINKHANKLYKSIRRSQMRSQAFYAEIGKTVCLNLGGLEVNRFAFIGFASEHLRSVLSDPEECSRLEAVGLDLYRQTVSFHRSLRIQIATMTESDANSLKEIGFRPNGKFWSGSINLEAAVKFATARAGNLWYCDDEDEKILLVRHGKPLPALEEARAAVSAALGEVDEASGKGEARPS